ISFTQNTPLSEPQANFLSNLNNKECFIAELVKFLNKVGIKATTARDDADALIIRRALSASDEHLQVAVVGQDVDLLVILIALAPEQKNIFFIKESSGTVKRRIYSSKMLQSSDVIHNSKESILFL